MSNKVELKLPSAFQSSPEGTHIVLTPEQNSLQTPGQHIVFTPEQTPPSLGNRVVLVAEDDPGEIFTGTYAGGSFLEKSLDGTDSDQIVANKAFKEWYTEIGQLAKAGLFGDRDDRIKDMTILDGTKEVEITLVNEETGDEKTSSFTVGEIKAKMIQARGNTLKAGQDVEKEIEGHFRAFDRVFKKCQFSRKAHYSASGPDVRGSAIGNKPLILTNTSPEIFKKKQVEDLFLAAERGLSEQKDWRGNKLNGGPLSIIERTIKLDPDTANLDTDAKVKTAQKEAMDRILRAESVLIELRKKLNAKIEEWDGKIQAEPHEVNKEPLRSEKKSLTDLRDQLQNETNRHALYVTAAFPNPNEAYEALLKDFYEDYLNEPDENNKPKLVYSEFEKSGIAEPYKKHAAEVASTLISHPGQYRRYCHTHGIEPKPNHINAFLNHALIQNNPYEDSDLTNFKTLNIAFDEDIKTEITTLVYASFEAVDKVGSQAHVLTETPEQHLNKALLKKSAIDPATQNLHGTVAKIRRWWNN